MALQKAIGRDKTLVRPAAWPSTVMQDGVLSQEDTLINELPDRRIVRDKDDGPRLVHRAQRAQENLTQARLHVIQGSIENQYRWPHHNHPGHQNVQDLTFRKQLPASQDRYFLAPRQGVEPNGSLPRDVIEGGGSSEAWYARWLARLVWQHSGFVTAFINHAG